MLICCANTFYSHVEHKEREQEGAAATTIGDLIREKMDQQGG